MNGKTSDRISNTSLGSSGIYYRLIALWVLSEAMLGGIIHGLNLPVSGLIVGSCAVVCICLIGWYIPNKGAILKATMIVAVFKMMLSPHTPPPAYIAVFFQGLMGELLFRNRKLFKLSCLLLATLALVESGLQRVISLTIIYGNDLWRAINDFLNGLTGQKTLTDYSLLIGAGYVLLHLITGIFVGWQVSLLPARIEKWSKEEENKILFSGHEEYSLPARGKKRKLFRKGLLIVWVILILLYVQSYFKIGKPLLPSHIPIRILVRSFIIVLSWIFIIGPLLQQLLHYWLQKKRTRSQKEIQQVLQLLPFTQQLISESWKRSSNKRGWKRIKSFSKMVLVNSLTPSTRSNIFILTNRIQTGKTTSLIEWSKKRNDVFGILTPVINGKRKFLDVHTQQVFDMEAMEVESDTLTIGRFVFGKRNFEKAIGVIGDSTNKEGWLFIDEIGPLELREEGFYEVVKKVITFKNENQKIILVAREGLADKVKELFGINDAIVINNISDLE